jgi:tetratricopeptide (TPR) repeat protein
MIFDAFKYFTGREEVIAGFDRLVSAEADRRLLLVSGLSGSGKSLVIDWLRRSRCKGIANAKLTLAPAFQETELLRSLALQVNPKTGREFEERLDELAKEERDHPLFNVPVNQRVEGRFGGRTADTEQTVVVNLGEAGNLIELQRRARRMDALVSSLKNIDTKPWVLFIDETEHLAQLDLRRFILDELIRRLREQTTFCRIYLSGQSVPVEAFALHEVEHIELGEFDAREVSQIAAKAGVDDSEISRHLLETTGGHPLLVGMWIEDAVDHNGMSDGIDGDELSAGADVGDRTRWIYDRIVRRFSDPTTRKIAANISLLEWFDLGILRSVFDQTLSEQAFEEMVSRSFIKKLGKNRWRCHDMVRKYLPAQRRAVDPVECEEVCRRAADAFLNRLKKEEERTGQTYFPERFTYAAAAIQSMLGFSVKQAQEFIYQELAHSCVEGTTDYLFAMARHLERSPDAEPFRALAEEIKTFLESLGVNHFDTAFVAFLEKLADFSIEHGERDVAAVLFQYAAGFAMPARNFAHAQTLAAKACDLNSSVANQLLLALSFSRAGNAARATEIIDSARQQHADSSELRFGEVKMAREQGDREKAIGLVTDIITKYPEDTTTALMQLAELCLEANDREGATKQLAVILEREPDYVPAIKLQADILVSEGKIEKASALMAQFHSEFTSIVSDAIELLNVLKQPAIRNRVLAEFRTDPRTSNPGVLLAAVDALALEGKQNEVEELLTDIEHSWPETSDIVSIKRAQGHMQRNAPGEIPSLLQPLADHGTFNADLYVILAGAYRALSQPDLERKTLERGMECVPNARDAFEAILVKSIANNHGSAQALRYLEKRERERDSTVGPISLLQKAGLLVQTDRNDLAIDLLEQLIYTQGSESLPKPNLVGARLMYASLLLQKNRKREAISVVDDTVDLFPDTDLALIGSAEIFAGIGDEQRVRRILRASQNQRASTRMRVIALLGQLIAARQTDINKLLEELARYPDRIELYHIIESLLINQGRTSELNGVIAQVEKIAPGLFVEIFELATRYRRELGGAVEELRNTLHREPGSLQLRLALAETLRLRGSLDEAIAVVDEAPNTSPDGQGILMNWKLIALIGADRMDEAEKVIRPYLDEMVNPPTQLLGVIAQFLEKKGDTAAELQFYQRAASASPSLSMIFKERVISLLLREKKPEKALQEIELIAGVGPLSPAMQFQKVDVLKALGRFDDAMTVLDNMAGLEHASKTMRGNVWSQRALIHLKQERNDQAIDCARKALEIDSDAILPRLLLGEAYEKARKPELAYESFRDAVAHEPSLASEFSDRLRNLYEQVNPKPGGPN